MTDEVLTEEQVIGIGKLQEKQNERIGVDMALLRYHKDTGRNIAVEIAEDVEKLIEAKAVVKALDANIKDKYVLLTEHNITDISPGPLFDQGDDDTEADGEAWREVSINELDISLHANLFMSDHTPPIDTLGKLSEFTSDGFARLADITGIGPVTAEEISDALVQWFAANPDKCPPVNGEQPDEE